MCNYPHCRGLHVLLAVGIEFLLHSRQARSILDGRVKLIDEFLLQMSAKDQLLETHRVGDILNVVVEEINFALQAARRHEKTVADAATVASIGIVRNTDMSTRKTIRHETRYVNIPVNLLR